MFVKRRQRKSLCIMMISTFITLLSKFSDEAYIIACSFNITYNIRYIIYTLYTQNMAIFHIRVSMC